MAYAMGTTSQYIPAVQVLHQNIQLVKTGNPYLPRTMADQLRKAAHLPLFPERNPYKGKLVQRPKLVPFLTKPYRAPDIY